MIIVEEHSPIVEIKTCKKIIFCSVTRFNDVSDARHVVGANQVGCL